MPSYPITLPLTGLVQSITIRPRTAAAPVSSIFTFQPQVQVWGGQLFMADVQLRPMSRASAEAIIAALVSLNGPEGSFYLGDTANKTARGAATGTPLVNGGSQSGYSLITDGWTAGVTNILRAGDWIEVTQGGIKRLHKVMEDVNSDGSGNATLAIWPKLRASPADNAAVVTSSPVGKFMLAGDIPWNISEAKLYGLSFSAVEDLRP